MKLYLIDGTYELFRHYYAVPSARDRNGREVGAVRGVLASLLGMMQKDSTHIAVATDHVIESFRNGLWAGAISASRRGARGSRNRGLADGGIRGRRRARRGSGESRP